MNLDDKDLLAVFPRSRFIPAANVDYQPIVRTGKAIGLATPDFFAVERVGDAPLRTVAVAILGTEADGNRWCRGTPVA